MLYPLYLCLTYCFSFLSDFLSFWCRFVIAFPLSNVTVNHLLPSQRNPIFVDKALCFTLCKYVFSNSQLFVFLSHCANGNLVIRLIILMHLNRNKPLCKRRSKLEIMSYNIFVCCGCRTWRHYCN